MKIVQKEISITTKGDTDIIDITTDVAKLLKKSGLVDGYVNLFVQGSTGSLTTIEYEPNLVEDFENALKRLIPSNIRYAHKETWGDSNGHSHVRASFMGPSLQVPFANKSLRLGTWQQIIFIDFDTRPRQRNIITQLIGT
ncbi:MAG: YjbQ family protein [Candidatus Omnitrophica bacterium]|nr:YjbQ family protein [Candidatus Omnitrophota bacterium]